MSLHFLIDGYNLIKRTPGLASKSLEDGRQLLIKLIEENRPQGSARNSVTIVFDGKPGIYGLPAAREVSVVFTEYETADDLIKDRVDEARNRKEIIVVTDDKQLMLYVRGLGSGVMTVGDFMDKVRGSSRGPVKPAKRTDKPKVISSTFEHAVNQEFEKIWLQKKPKPKA